MNPLLYAISSPWWPISGNEFCKASITHWELHVYWPYSVMHANAFFNVHVLSYEFVYSPGGEDLQYAWLGEGGLTELHIANPPKNTRAWNCTPKKITQHQNFLPPPQKLPGTKISYPPPPKKKISILIYSIKQTLRPRKICDRSLDPKKYQGCNFLTQKKYVGPLWHWYWRCPPGALFMARCVTHITCKFFICVWKFH